MKFLPESRTLELTDRNINALKEKLDDPASARAIGSPCGRITVRATEDEGRASTDTSGGVVTVTRSELVAMLAGETVTVGGIGVVPVPDAAHYSSRPAGDVYMPGSGELRPGVLAMSLRHICEVCGKTEILTPAEAYEEGWDYPPRTGAFRVIGPRVCPVCPNTKTVWWAVAMDNFTEDMLTAAQRETIARILGEPGSIMVTESER